jgi:hypothetical protein
LNSTHTHYDLPKTEREFLQPSRWQVEAGATVFFGDRSDDRRLTWNINFLDAKGKKWEAKISTGRSGLFQWSSWESRMSRSIARDGASVSWRRAARAIWFAAHPEGLEKVRAERKRAAEAEKHYARIIGLTMFYDEELGAGMIGDRTKDTLHGFPGVKLPYDEKDAQVAQSMARELDMAGIARVWHSEKEDAAVREFIRSKGWIVGDDGELTVDSSKELAF